MFYHPDLIVYIWLLPVTLMIVIPALMATLGFLIGLVKATSGAEESFQTVPRGAVIR